MPERDNCFQITCYSDTFLLSVKLLKCSQTPTKVVFEEGSDLKRKETLSFQITHIFESYPNLNLLLKSHFLKCLNFLFLASLILFNQKRNLHVVCST